MGVRKTKIETPVKKRPVLSKRGSLDQMDTGDRIVLGGDLLMLMHAKRQFPINKQDRMFREMVYFYESLPEYHPLKAKWKTFKPKVSTWKVLLSDIQIYIGREYNILLYHIPALNHGKGASSMWNMFDEAAMQYHGLSLEKIMLDTRMKKYNSKVKSLITGERQLNLLVGTGENIVPFVPMQQLKNENLLTGR